MCDVYNVASTLEARVSKVFQFVDDAQDLPDGIADLEVYRQNNQLHIKSQTNRDDIGKYTPTAYLVGTTREREVVVEDGEPTNNTIRQEESERPGWNDLTEEDDVETTTIEYVKFQGEGDRILRNSALRTEMFNVLCDLADISYYGTVEGILVDDDITPVCREAEGKDIDVELSIDPVEDDSFSANDERSKTVQWSAQ